MSTLPTKLAVFVPVVSLILVGIFIWIKHHPSSLCNNLSCIHIQNSSSYHLQDIYADTATAYRALYTSSNGYIRISVQKANAQNAKKYLDASVLRMKALFEKAPAPYPGDISDAIVCDPLFEPTYQTITTTHGVIQYFIGFLNNRLTFGSCSKDQAVYKGIMAFTFCPSHSLNIQIERILPVEKFATDEDTITTQFLSFTCAD